MAEATTAGAADTIWGTGRRKSSVARVRVRRGGGLFTVNGRPMEEYFRLVRDRGVALSAAQLLGARDKVDIHVTVSGGGTTGQAGAIAMGLARALRKSDASYEDPLRHSGLLTRDSRMKERKKYGLHGARRGCQFSKR